MILNEIDPISSREEILLKLQQILDDIRQNTITKQEALDRIEAVHLDVNMRAELTTHNYLDTYHWDFLRLTILNLIEFIKEL